MKSLDQRAWFQKDILTLGLFLSIDFLIWGAWGLGLTHLRLVDGQLGGFQVTWLVILVLLATSGLVAIGAWWLHIRNRLRNRQQDMMKRIGSIFVADASARAYGAVAEVLLPEFQASHVVFGWIEAWNSLAWLHRPDDAPFLVAREHWHKDWQELFQEGVIREASTL